MPTSAVFRVVRQLLRGLLQNGALRKQTVAVARVVVKRAATQPSLGAPGFISKQVWRGMARGAPRNLRTAALGVWHRSNELSAACAMRSQRFAGMAWRRDAAARYQLIDKVRELFGENVRLIEAKRATTYPNTLSGYDIGGYIAKGCNGVVCEAAVRRPEQTKPAPPAGLELSATHQRLQPEPALMPLHYRHTALAPNTRENRYPLAIKMMFNYNFDAPESEIFDAFRQELVPVTETVLRGNFGSVLNRRRRDFRGLSRQHPNVVGVHTAFIDGIPSNLPCAAELYPDAIPQFEDLFLSQPAPPQTMFLVMKRYTKTLYEYVHEWLSDDEQPRCRRVLAAQLFEGVRFLAVDQRIAHRDLKSDNILLHFDTPNDIPTLAISDFGTSHGSLSVPHFSDDADLGGNLALRAPEVKTSKPRHGSYIDVSKADLWAAGTLAYEIFTGSNPFYNVRKLDSRTYAEKDLPPLPTARLASPVLGRLLADVLRRRPEQRPDATLAANVWALSLFRLRDLTTLIAELRLGVCAAAVSACYHLNDLHGVGLSKMDPVGGAISLFFAETVMSSRLNDHLSSAEITLRNTVGARLYAADVEDAVRRYFMADDSDVV